MNTKEEMKEHEARITKLTNQITNCYNPDLKQHLQYELRQELIEFAKIKVRKISLYNTKNSFEKINFQMSFFTVYINIHLPLFPVL